MEGRKRKEGINGKRESGRYVSVEEDEMESCVKGGE